MNDPFSSNADAAGNFFQQAMDGFQSAVTSGVKLQEESVKRYTQLLRDFASPEQWQSGAQGLVQEAIRATEQNVDDSVRGPQLLGADGRTLAPGAGEATGPGRGAQRWRHSPLGVRPDGPAHQRASGAASQRPHPGGLAQLAQEMTNRVQTFQDEVRKTAEQTRDTMQQTQRRAAEASGRRTSPPRQPQLAFVGLVSNLQVCDPNRADWKSAPARDQLGQHSGQLWQTLPAAQSLLALPVLRADIHLWANECVRRNPYAAWRAVVAGMGTWRPWP